ncbi:MAG: CoA pyrophosphatase [Pseudomonadota bacterium]
MLVVDKLRKIFVSRPRNKIEDKDLIPAAVLLLLYEKHGIPYLLFTKRTEKVADHKGQISFPGGVRDKNDESLEITALREASEEIGIDGDKVEVIGLLDDCTTVSTNYVITPVVGVFSSLPTLTVNQEEVSEIIEVPLSLLHDSFKGKNGANKYIPGYPEFHYGQHIIWGATARILYQFLSLLALAD